MQTVPMAIRTEPPSIRKIIMGIFKLVHIKQFIVFVLSVSVLLWIIPVIKTKTFIWIVIVCAIIFIGLYIFELMTRQPENRTNQWTNNYEMMNTGNSTIANNYSNEKLYTVETFHLDDFPGESGVCGVCLEKMRDGTEVGVLPCFHCFHPQCIEKYTKVRSYCPVCKASIKQQIV